MNVVPMTCVRLKLALSRLMTVKKKSRYTLEREITEKKKQGNMQTNIIQANK